MTQWCCEAFEQLLEYEDDKGFSIIAVKDGQYDNFYLCANPFEKEVAEELNAIDPQTGFVRCPEIRDSKGKIVPLVTRLYFIILHCPSCGAKMSKFIVKNQTIFDNLAIKHRRLWTGK